MTNVTILEVWELHSSSKMCNVTGKIGLKFWKLTFLWVDSQIFYKFSKNTSEITRFEKERLKNSEKVYWPTGLTFINIFTCWQKLTRKTLEQCPWIIGVYRILSNMLATLSYYSSSK